MMLGALAAVALVAHGADDVTRLGWMTGSWVQERDGAVVRETWLPPQGGAMAGVGQTIRPGRKPFIEFMKITAEPAGATFTAVLPGQPPTPFVLKPSPEGEAVFENPGHDFPQRVFYRRCGEDLCAGIEGVQDGKPRREEWRYRRVR